jgi:tetratricopeptide (TPR) repeat protein
MRGATFWITMTVFQLAFGLTVFALTRHYYMSSAPAPQLPAWAVGLGTALPGGAAPVEPRAAAPGQAPFAASADDDPSAMSQRADAAFSSGNYAEAAALYERLLAIDPQNVELHNNLGLTLHYLGRADESLETLAAGLKIDPTHQRTWLTTGFVNLRLGKTAEARAALAKARDIGTDTQIRQSAEKMLAGLPQ